MSRGDHGEVMRLEFNELHVVYGFHPAPMADADDDKWRGVGFFKNGHSADIVK